MLRKVSDTKAPISLGKTALEALQRAAADYLSAIFKDANASALHAGWKTDMLKDMHFANDYFGYKKKTLSKWKPIDAPVRN